MYQYSTITHCIIHFEKRFVKFLLAVALKYMQLAVVKGIRKCIVGEQKEL